MINRGIDTLNDAKNIVLLNRALKALLKKGILTKAEINAETEERFMTEVQI